MPVLTSACVVAHLHTCACRRENQGYSSFEDFLAALKQSKRKNVRQERKAVAAAGLRLRRLTGDDLTPGVWDRFYEFYQNTTCKSERGLLLHSSSTIQPLSLGMSCCTASTVAFTDDMRVHILASDVYRAWSEVERHHAPGCAANKWGQQYLTREFFHQLGERMPERVLLAVAEQDGELVAGALAVP